ncbi:hypothetical protein [Herbiconiux liukaitaii]|uniref:hypothetical protein n=1 Tax=Herbiconiux liukaitaii TaxID=3342799 RepID=UPI0035B702CF
MKRALGTAAAVVGLLVALVVAYWGWGFVAEQRTDSAYSVLDARMGSLREAQGALVEQWGTTQRQADRVRTVVSSAPFAGDTDASAEALRSALGSLDLTLTAARTQADAATSAWPDGDEDGGAQAVEKPPLVVPWEQMAEAEEVEAAADRANLTANELLAAAVDTSSSEQSLSEAEVAYFASLSTRARAEAEASTLATKKSRVDLGLLLDQAADPSQSGSWTSAFIDTLEAARQGVRESQALEAAELADPALETRREIEAYARSLSAGVVLDFVWAPEVSGLGDGWLSGTAETYSGDGGWSIITLNYTVEEAWEAGDDNARAIVAHEVGHTQFIREVCEPLFTGPVFNSDHETWATAFSIGLGFDIPGSGIEAYGRPTDEQVATAAQCR